ncbi:MAG TPA: OmpH family outer membrane protein [Chryseolinea sp.]|nr:OmpH family outer membrane protein [Chryseolinea sp.]HPM32877.1 OmpH family outer membrane protein [Chryseolinea sp.]
MKNLSLILNAVLLVAVGVLFYLHFAGTKSATTTSGEAFTGDAKIAFINSDSVLKNYAYLDANKKILEEKSKKLEAEYRNRAIGLQNEITSYQRNVSSMTMGQVKAVEEDLGKKQQNLQMYQQSLGQQLAEEEGKLNKELYDRITAFLKKYSSEQGFNIVLKYDPSSDVLFAGEALNISDAVTKGLNDEYAAEKSGTGVKADSTSTKK